MNIQNFQSIATHLLQKHYGLTLNDTEFSEQRSVQVILAHGQRPYEAINELAEERDLHRTDLEGPWGTPSKQQLTKADEDLALAKSLSVFEMGEEIVHCPTCGSRTNFGELGGQRQHHTCLNASCGAEFITEPVEDTEEEPEEDFA